MHRSIDSRHRSIDSGRRHREQRRLVAVLFSFTVTRTNATVDPSGEICGSAIQVNLSRSDSVMNRLPCARGAIDQRDRADDYRQ